MLRGEGFHMQVGIGETVRAGGVGRIIESAADGWDVGEAVMGGVGAQTVATLPVNELKLDRGFVADLERGASEETVVRAIVMMGQSLGKLITAEGIETAEQLAGSHVIASARNFHELIESNFLESIHAHTN